MGYGLYARYVWPREVVSRIHTAIERDCSIEYMVDTESIDEHTFWVDTYISPNGEIDVSALPKGIYTIEIRTKSALVQKRFVKN